MLPSDMLNSDGTFSPAFRATRSRSHRTVAAARLPTLPKFAYGGIFPALAYAENGGYSNGFQKWYNRFLKSIGLKGGTAKAGLVFHSFRHTFRDRLREAEVHGEFVNRLGGWTESNSTAKDYGHGPSIPKLYEQIATVSYPKLDLTHLHVS